VNYQEILDLLIATEGAVNNLTEAERDELDDAELLKLHKVLDAIPDADFLEIGENK